MYSLHLSGKGDGLLPLETTPGPGTLDTCPACHVDNVQHGGNGQQRDRGRHTGMSHGPGGSGREGCWGPGRGLVSPQWGQGQPPLGASVAPLASHAPTLCAPRKHSPWGPASRTGRWRAPQPRQPAPLISQCMLHGQGRPFLLSFQGEHSPAPARGQPSNPWGGAGPGLLAPSSTISLAAPALCEHLRPGILPSGEHEHTTPARLRQPAVPLISVSVSSFTLGLTLQSHVRSFS